MKRRLLTLFIMLFSVALVLGSFAACDDSSDSQKPNKLDAPVVTLNGNVATWQPNTNADKFEISLDGNLSYVENTVTSKALTAGQSLKVRAVGDGTNYSTSDWSNIVTYTTGGHPNPDAPAGAPRYLGITASNEQPSESDRLPEIFIQSYASNGYSSVSLEDSLKSFLNDSSNALGDPLPSASSYGIYSAAGRTVYIQIWLENTEQNTILSLKLNGVKYQSGGALQSFFIADGNSYKNCVYVAVTVPAGSYNEISYEVTEIEYVEGTNVNQDGKSVLIDEENDTVKIGLPYQQAMPTAALSETARTASSVSISVNVTDTDNYVSLVGGWLRAIVFNNQNEILAQKKLNIGANTVTFDNLSADTYYTVMVFVLGDTHDGNGVYAHSLARERYRTESVITCEAQSEILYNSATGKYYPNVSVEATLSDPSFEFTKIELGKWNQEAVFTSAFDGSIDITQVLNGESYMIKVYYKNGQNVEQYYVTNVYVDSFDYPNVSYDMGYGLVDDAVIGFAFSDGKYNLSNIKIQMYDENSKRYLAENAVYLIENPNVIEQLEAQWMGMGRDNPDFHSTYDRWYKLNQTKNKIDEYFSEVTEQEWRAELSKGIYMYEFVFGTDEEFFKGADNKYYVVLKDYQLKRVDKGTSWKYIVTADIDENNGQPIENKTLVDGFFKVDPAIGENDYLFAEKFTLDDNNVLYLETKSRNNFGNESYRELGYVKQIVLRTRENIITVLWEQNEPDHDIDEADWLADVKAALIAGDDVNSVFPLGNMEPITFDLDNVDIPGGIGTAYIQFSYVMYGKDYTGEDEPFDWCGATVEYTFS